MNAFYHCNQVVVDDCKLQQVKQELMWGLSWTQCGQATVLSQVDYIAESTVSACLTLPVFASKAL